MRKILSIIIPSYNMENYISKCLDSLIINDKNLFRKLDIIVVNDGSKDRTSEIAHEYEAKYPDVIRVIDKKNGHYGSCVNAGLICAQGVYIRILDSDDYVITASFEKCCINIEEEAAKNDDGADLLISSYQNVTSDGTIKNITNYGLREKKEYYTLDDLPKSSPRFSVHSVVYRTEFLRKMNYRQTEGMSYTDTEWIIEPMTRVRRFRYIPEVVTCYLVGRDGQSIDPIVFSRDFYRIADITVGLIDRFQQYSKDCEEKSLRYYQTRIAEMIEFVYHYWYKGYCGYKCEIDIFDFDRHVSKEPILYNISDQFYFETKNYKFYFIHNLRHWHTRYSPTWFVFMAHRVWNYVLRKLSA